MSDRRCDAPFLLSVDGAGQYLVAAGQRFVLGHVRGGAADLPFLADLGARHALLERTDSLRAGSSWSITPLADERVYVNGERTLERRTLASGDRVRLGENLVFRFREPAPASETPILRFPEGIDCAGGLHVLLFARGEGGRVRIGGAGQRHVLVPGLEHELTLVREDARLWIRCDASIRASAGAACEEEERGVVSVRLPLECRLDLVIGRPRGSRPPFGIALGPSVLPASGSLP